MRPLLIARISDLRPGDFVFIQCACGRVWLATKTLLTTSGIPSNLLIAKLPLQLHCPNCGERGRSTVSVKWAEASVGRP
jgi:hypothetical protein